VLANESAADSSPADWIATVAERIAMVQYLGLHRTLLMDDNPVQDGRVLTKLLCAPIALLVGHCVQWGLFLPLGALAYACSVGRNWREAYAVLVSDLHYMLAGAVKVGLQLLVNFVCIPVGFTVLTVALLLPHIRPEPETPVLTAIVCGLLVYVQCVLYHSTVDGMTYATLLRPEYQLQLIRAITITDGALSSLGNVLHGSFVYLMAVTQYMVAGVIVPLLLGRYLCPLPLPPDLSISGRELVLHLDPSVVLPGGWVLRLWDLTYLMLLETVLSFPNIVLRCQVLMVHGDLFLARLAGLGHLMIDITQTEDRLYPAGTPQVPLSTEDRRRYTVISKVRLLAVLSAWLHRAPLVAGRWAWYLATSHSGPQYEAASDLFLYPLGLVLTWQTVTSAVMVTGVRSATWEGSSWLMWLLVTARRKTLAVVILLADLLALVQWVAVPGFLTGLLLHRLGHLLGCVLGAHGVTETHILSPAQLLLTGNAAWTTLKW
jgi:hypothetical protein